MFGALHHVYRPLARFISANLSDYRVFSVYRFNPDKDVKPHVESYAVNIKEYYMKILFQLDVEGWFWMLYCILKSVLTQH